MSTPSADMPTDALPFAFSTPLAVCVDVRHPLSYLAFRPVCALAAELGLSIDWLPFPVPPLAPLPAVDAEGSRGSRHRRWRAENTEQEIARYAAVQGLDLKNIHRSSDSTLAALGLFKLRGIAADLRGSYLERVFEGYWQETLDIEDPAAIRRVLEDLGVESRRVTDFASDAARAELVQLRARLVAAGIFAVPSLVAGGEVFVGRAHLPLVKRILTGSA